jgi:hypothetical protein
LTHTASPCPIAVGVWTALRHGGGERLIGVDWCRKVRHLRYHEATRRPSAVIARLAFAFA